MNGVVILVAALLLITAIQLFIEHNLLGLILYAFILFLIFGT